MIAGETRIADLPFVTCAGAPSVRGETHGEALRERIRDGLGNWLEAIGKTHEIDPDAYLQEFIQGTDYLPAIERWTPDLLEEMAGIARGANQPWERIYAYNLPDEEWHWAKSRLAGEIGCSAFGLHPDGASPLLAQTMDLPSVHDGTQAVLSIEPEDGSAVRAFTSAGLVALTGCNDAGLAVVVNNLGMLPSSSSGLPVVCIIRGVLARRSLNEAVAFVSGVNHASGQHYGIAGPDGLASLEGSGEGVVGGEPGQTLLHTNHPLLGEHVNGAWRQEYEDSSTWARLDHLERSAVGIDEVPAMQQVLSDCTVPISLGAERPVMTFGAVVYQCEVPARMWLSPGPPHETPFVELERQSFAAPSLLSGAV
jgi:isopenicillin-N N-acyltransferase-like protein